MTTLRSLAATLVLAPALSALGAAQLVGEDFSNGNTHAWCVDFGTPGAHQVSGGNPGGCLALTVASGGGGTFPVRTVVPGAVTHPWRGNFRALGVSAFRFDRQVLLGSSNFGTRPTLLLGSDNGTRTNIADDTWVWVWTGDNFQFGASPWTTITTAIPSSSTTLPTGFGVAALPQSPNAGNPDVDALWNLVIQDVDFVGISMGTPWNGGGWFGSHDMLFDNFALLASNVGSAYCAPAVTNSTGAPATILATGSTFVATNNLRLTASALPTNTFGFFLTSRTQGFVAQPGGSQGNLCLGGNVGRYVGPGQIQSSGATGTIALQLNLTAMPQPTGPTPALAGQTWNFQGWYRDAVGGTATSNFTSGVAVTLQ